jgi:hypothetical protein
VVNQYNSAIPNHVSEPASEKHEGKPEKEDKITLVISDSMVKISINRRFRELQVTNQLSICTVERKQIIS